VATKAVLADQVRQKDQALGDLTYLVLRAMDRADLRQWSTLPETIQVIRVPLDPGTYSYQLDGVYALSGSALTGESYGSREVEIKKGKKTFVVWRSLK
ncbi:MAG TPA: hypothetical protein PL182_04560, partial [Pseudobdellovibrionaceae bacterium]|nr:hypothetical protein [Pseudobdellovibrionaceae bacterium]